MWARGTFCPSLVVLHHCSQFLSPSLAGLPSSIWTRVGGTLFATHCHIPGIQGCCLLVTDSSPPRTPHPHLLSSLSSHLDLTLSPTSCCRKFLSPKPNKGGGGGSAGLDPASSPSPSPGSHTKARGLIASPSLSDGVGARAGVSQPSASNSVAMQ